jgi:glycolate oxidase
MGARMVKVAETAAEEAAMWEPRGAITSSLARLKPGKIGEDICVPRTKLPEVVEAITNLSRETGLEIALFGHAGDGTLHPNIVFDPADEGEVAKVKEVMAGIARIGIEAGGVLSGEHGLGLVKKEFVPLMYDWETIGRMRALKREMDPAGILNPEVMWPEEPED